MENTNRVPSTTWREESADKPNNGDNLTINGHRSLHDPQTLPRPSAHYYQRVMSASEDEQPLDFSTKKHECKHKDVPSSKPLSPNRILNNYSVQTATSNVISTPNQEFNQNRIPTAIPFASSPVSNDSSEIRTYSNGFGSVSPSSLFPIHDYRGNSSHSVYPNLSLSIPQPVGPLTVSNSNPLSSVPSLSQCPSDLKKHTKYTRPFKAYQCETGGMGYYYGLPMEVPFSSDANAAQNILANASNNAYLQFRESMLARKRSNGQQIRKTKSETSPSNSQTPMSPDNSLSMISPDESNDASTDGECPCSANPVDPNECPSTSETFSTSTNSKKRSRTFPNELKDDAYWERRRKNNEAAKRSRDARRAKEDEIAIRAAFLEQENIKLKVEIASLRSETSKLRFLLYHN